MESNKNRFRRRSASRHQHQKPRKNQKNWKCWSPESSRVQQGTKCTKTVEEVPDSENKESLISFLCEHWCTYASSHLSNLDVLYVTSKEKCYSFSRGMADNALVFCDEVSELKSSHEEADTRLLLHAKHAAIENDRIIIKSPDSDVFLLCIAMQRVIEKDLYFMTGTGNRFRVIHIRAIAETLGENVCQSELLVYMKYSTKI